MGYVGSYQEKMLVLNRLNTDLDSMAEAVGVATIFVDAELFITRFTPEATRIFKLRDSDVGRPLSDFSHTLRYPDLLDDLAQTLRTQQMIEREVSACDGRKTYLIRILPYLIPSTPLHGAVVSFVDMTAFHDARRLQAVLDALPEHIAVLDHAGTIVMVNAAWRRFALTNGDRDLKRFGPGVNYFEVCPTDDLVDSASAQAAALGLRQVLEGSRPLFALEYPCHSPTEQRWFVMNVAPIASQDFGAVVSHVNITAWHSPPEPPSNPLDAPS